LTLFSRNWLLQEKPANSYMLPETWRYLGNFLISLDEKCRSRAFDDWVILQICDGRRRHSRPADGPLSFEPNTLRRH